MFWALFNDLVQRGLTLNKTEQKRKLSKKLRALNLNQGSRVLDFGCGTGLFSSVFTKEHLIYYGYDIDKRLTDYAARITKNKASTFTASFEELEKDAPFDLIIANCCFHHIASSSIDTELQRIRELLKDDGIFMLIDILLAESDTHFLRRHFRRLEQGAFVRTVFDYVKLVERHFKIIRTEEERSHLFSVKNNPVYNDLIVLYCKKTI